MELIAHRTINESWMRADGLIHSLACALYSAIILLRRILINEVTSLLDGSYKWRLFFIRFYGY